MKTSYAQQLLKKTENDYNRIAHKFSNTRRNITDDFKDLKKYLNTDDRILDLGCGDGRLLEVIGNEKVSYVGADVSGNIIKIAGQKHPKSKFIKINGLKLPFENDSFDTVFALAVFHHIPGFTMRAKFIKEIKRVLKKDGKVILTVWNFKKTKIGKSLILKYGLLSFVRDLDWGDVFYPFSVPEENLTIKRYLHSFSKTELENYFNMFELKILESKTVTRGKKVINENLMIVAKK